MHFSRVQLGLPPSSTSTTQVVVIVVFCIFHIEQQFTYELKKLKVMRKGKRPFGVKARVGGRSDPKEYYLIIHRLLVSTNFQQFPTCHAINHFPFQFPIQLSENEMIFRQFHVPWPPQTTTTTPKLIFKSTSLTKNIVSALQFYCLFWALLVAFYNNNACHALILPDWASPKLDHHNQH